jgi:two-component system C4-dicarboxylate transport response regulator DctD
MIQKVLLVDDDAAVREALAQTLELADLTPILANSFTVARDKLGTGFDGIVVTDIRMPGKDGFALLEYVQALDADLPVILLTGEGDIPMAVRGMTAGAFDFLEKPCEPAQLLASVRKALRTRALVLENRTLRREIETGDAAARMIVGVSRSSEELRALLRKLARADVSVLIRGEPGTGTARVAEVLHLLSPRASMPFTRVSGATLSAVHLPDLIARTGEGSLFVDEVAALAPGAQYALLEAMERAPTLPVRAGTHRDLAQEVADGRFNAELFYRLELAQVEIPPLRERTEDIPAMFRHFVAKACEEAALPLPEVPETVIDGLMEQDWPGNARALQNVAMRFALGVADLEDREAPGLNERLRRVERSMIVEALQRHAGNASETARALGLPRKTFYDKLARHDLRPDAFRGGSESV